jgi:hypothetical protein
MIKRIVTAAAVVLFAAIGGYALFLAATPPAVTHSGQPVWTDAAWPFPMDQWGQGWAYQCKAADCGIEVNLYLRPKIGFCNCQTGVADDEESRSRRAGVARARPGGGEPRMPRDCSIASATSTSLATKDRHSALAGPLPCIG